MDFFTIKNRSRIVAVCVLSGAIVIFVAETRETLVLDRMLQFRPAGEPLRAQQAVEFPNVVGPHASMSVQPRTSGNVGVWFPREDGTLSAFPLSATVGPHRRMD
jgi:hypothetical protein